MPVTLVEILIKTTLLLAPLIFVIYFFLFHLFEHVIMKKVHIELCEINITFMTPLGSVVFIAQAVGCLHSWQPTVGKINNKGPDGT